jgi:glycosyltransferase involved in cell wall biosynthesis
MIPITFFIDNKLGGVSSLNYNLIRYAPSDFKQTVIHIEDTSSPSAKANISYPVDKQEYIKFSKKENAYAVLKKMHRALSEKQGALVLNYGSEMAMLDHFPVNQTTYQLVHDDYNLNLSKLYGHVVDVFICHNAFIEASLLKLFPDRQSDIFFLSHGVEIPQINRMINSMDEPLRLLFLGRLATSKGIYDLPKIAELLRRNNVYVKWTCVGAGPEASTFKESWHKDDDVIFLSPTTNEEVIQICSQNDVFVLPTKFEGTPVSLLETMSAGLVPVITDLPGGIHEIVNSSVGFALPIDDHKAFAAAIIDLDKNREKLNVLSKACQTKIKNEFNLVDTSKKYYELFARFEAFRKEKKLQKQKVGSRLDHPIIPNTVTQLIRKFSR